MEKNSQLSLTRLPKNIIKFMKKSWYSFNGGTIKI